MKKTYRIRGKVHEILGEGSERDVLRLVAKGKFTGEEEVSVSPHFEWQKISSHPLFYDAFLRRLYRDEYAAPDGQEAEGDVEPSVSRPSESRPEKATRHKDRHEHTKEGHLPHADSEHPAGAATSRLDQGQKEGGGTLHASLIQELFTASGVESSKKAGSGLIPLDPEGLDEVGGPAVSDGREPTVKLHQPLDLAKGAAGEELPPEVVQKRGRDSRRRLLVAGSLAAVLALLFQMGTGETPKAKQDDIASFNQKRLATEAADLIDDPARKEERVRTLVEEADRLYENDTPLFYQESQNLFHEALKYDEGNAAILARLAEATARLIPESTPDEKLDEEVIEIVRRGRTKDPQLSQFYRAEALTNLAKGDFHTAAVQIGNALQADPSNVENFLVQGEIALAGGDMETAKGSIKEVVDSNSQSIRGRHFQGKIAFLEGDLARAESEAIATLKLNPIHAASYCLLGKNTVARGKTKEGLQLIDTCVSLAKFAPGVDVAEALVVRSALQEKAGDAAGAKKSLQLAKYYAPTDAKIAEKTKGIGGTEAEGEALAALSEYTSSYFSEQAENLVTQKKLRESMIFFQASYLLSPRDGAPLVRLGEVAERLANSYDDFRLVMSYFQRAVRRDPTLTKAYIRIGLLEAQQYNLERAFKILKQAEALSPEEAAPYVALGKYHHIARDYEAALTQFTKAYKIDSQNSEILYNIGLVRTAVPGGADKKAAELFYRAYLLDPSNYDALVEWLKLKVQDYEKNFAIRFVKNLIDAEPKNANLFWALGEIYVANKEFRRGITFFHQALDLDNRSSKVRMALGRALESVGEIETAVAEYRLASFLDRRNGEGFYRAADLQFQAKKYRESEELLRFLIGISPHYPGAHRYLSRIFQAQGKKTESVAEMRTEVTNNPMNYRYRLELAELLMEYALHQEAITELKELTNLPSVREAPDLAFEKERAYLLLSRCFRALSQFESAEPAIRLALETDPEDPDLHRELGFVLADLHRDKEAVKAFEYYLNRSPAAQDAENIKSLIQNLEIQE